ncbi:MAG: DUF512 domain-containing protein [Ruminococcus sp.]|nr:DUF512 domain-containing protein [Ruminococcus sp.]
MSVIISSVIKGSKADRCGIKSGDTLIAINGNTIEDVLDYMFYIAVEKVSLSLERDGEAFEKTVRKSEYDDIGLEFDTFLMDKKRSCSNKCIFCFIDQMPKGMRETLYFKDDDARLSFLQGNYVTLTNLDDRDIERIIKMRLNINVSVHTTNPELRCKMMNNRFAGDKLRFLKMLTDAGIELNCQIVCCPGINDGKELVRTLTDLERMMPNIQSVAVVPVGITKFREGLFPMKIFNKETAGAAIDVIEAVQKDCLEKYGTRMVFASDEFYITAERPIPDADYYEEYPQYENGVGLLRSLSDEVDAALDMQEEFSRKRKVSLATGTLAGGFHKELVKRISARFPTFECNVYPIVNHFFGETITVAGLVTGGDLIEQLKGQDLGEELIIPKVMLKADEDIFLDDVTLDEVREALDIKITPIANDGYDYLDALLGVSYGE